MQSSLYKLTRSRVNQLKIVLKHLFPEFHSIKIKRKTGIIRFKRSFYSLKSLSFHISELCSPSGEIVTRLAKMRLDCPHYISIYNWNLEDILRDNLCNIVEWIFYEFVKIKKTSPMEFLLERETLLLPEDSGRETIGSIINQLVHPKAIKINKSVTKQISKLYKEFCIPKESLLDKKGRAEFFNTFQGY